MKNGFTLIELLAVIVILAVIALIATPIVLSIINDTKESAVIRSAEFYVDAVENRIMQENMKLGGKLNPEECIVNNEGNVTCDRTPLEIEVNGDKPDSGSITFDRGRVTSITLTFGERKVVTNQNGELVLEEEPQKKPQEDTTQVCTLISGEANEIGSKYECEVKFGTKYNFYVLSHENDGTTNLIMDRNICEDGTLATEGNTCAVAWVSKIDYNDDTNYGTDGNNNKGPITAINHLYNATKEWTNIPNMIIDYTDEGNTGSSGYGSIKTTNELTQIIKKDESIVTVLTNQTGYSKLKARMPYRGEIVNYDGTNGYLYDNLSLLCVNSVYDEETREVHGEVVDCDIADTIFGLNAEGLSHILGIYGYRALSSHTGGPNYAWYLDDRSYVVGKEVSYDDANGVRPVINLKL